MRITAEIVMCQVIEEGRNVPRDLGSNRLSLHGAYRSHGMSFLSRLDISQHAQLGIVIFNL